MLPKEYEELLTVFKRKLTYDSSTGHFTWTTTRNKSYIGKIAGSPTAQGYLMIRVNKRHMLLHRLAYLWIHGTLPQFIDHINGNRADNQISNLRSATVLENNRNKSAQAKASSRYLGVSYVRPTGKWIARIRHSGKNNHLGTFMSETEAAKSYNEVASRYFGEFAKLNIIEEKI